VFNYICNRFFESDASRYEESDYSDDSSELTEFDEEEEESKDGIKVVLRLDLKYLCDRCGKRFV
jgi:hypothetical protein